jgi:hypothetical protein
MKIYLFYHRENFVNFAKFCKTKSNKNLFREISS